MGDNKTALITLAMVVVQYKPNGPRTQDHTLYEKWSHKTRPRDSVILAYQTVLQHWISRVLQNNSVNKLNNAGSLRV